MKRGPDQAVQAMLATTPGSVNRIDPVVELSLRCKIHVLPQARPET